MQAINVQDDECKVIVLYDGYSIQENSHMRANCSSVLIKGEKNILVDTLSACDGSDLLDALRENGIECEDISYVICTHGHPDHIGCNYMFPNATLVVGFNISFKHTYYDHDFRNGNEYMINNKVKVIPTPGHTLQDISVIVDSPDGIIAITGDLFEKEEDLQDDQIWINAGSDSQELQRLNRAKILNLADYIIPGHGPMFRVPLSNKIT